MNILPYIRSKTIAKIFTKVKKPVPFFYQVEGFDKDTLLCDHNNFYKYNQSSNGASFTQIKIDHKFVNGIHGFKLIKRPDLDFYALYQAEYGAKKQLPLYELKEYY